MQKTVVEIEHRFPLSGFVYVNHKRMMFAPQSVARRVPKSDNEPLILTQGNWGILTTREIQQCKEALVADFPGREVIVSQDC